MSSRFAAAPLVDVRQDAQLLVEHIQDHAGQLEAFVAAAEEDVRHAEAAVSHATDREVEVSEVRRNLRSRSRQRGRCSLPC